MNEGEPRILIAEDEACLQFLLTKQLAKLGYKAVDVAKNGNIAVQKALEIRFNLILMDVMMPELDGIAATEQICKFEEQAGKRTPIIALTGITDKERCLNSGMVDYLQKPVMLDSLKQTLQKWLKAAPSIPPVQILPADPARTAHGTIEVIETVKQSPTIENRTRELRKRLGLDH